MKRTIQAAWLAFREGLSQASLQRTPEPTPDMSELANVLAFHAEGSEHGALLGVYQFNARQIHCLAPEGGTIVDLGCGSGQCLGYIARRRPDLRIIGMDLSEEMVNVGNAMLRKQRLSDRVELRVGDMTTFVTKVPKQVHLITSIFSLHHLPTREDLHACLREIEQIRGTHRAGLWIFDHARPRRRDTANRFPSVFTPLAPAAFNADSTNSLIAAWSFEELHTAITSTIGGEVESSFARLLRLYQIHWAKGPSVDAMKARLWQEPESIPKLALRDANGLAGLFGKLPEGKTRKNGGRGPRSPT
jgi:arsenite methyltransferase